MTVTLYQYSCCCCCCCDTFVDDGFDAGAVAGAGAGAVRIVAVDNALIDCQLGCC
jgi:hypothetical protein